MRSLDANRLVFVDESGSNIALTPVLAIWVIRSGNRHFESGILFLYRLQTKEGKGKTGSRQSILML